MRRERVNGWGIACAALAAWMLPAVDAHATDGLSQSKTPIVLLVGCARETDQPHIWTLSTPANVRSRLEWPSRWTRRSNCEAAAWRRHLPADWRCRLRGRRYLEKNRRARRDFGPRRG